MSTLVIMAAGLASRYGGIKQMEGVGPNGEILMEYALYDAAKAGFNKAVIILRRDIIDDFRERFGSVMEKVMPVSYAVQELTDIPEGCSVPDGRTKPWGTVHAVLAASGIIDENFAVINADDYYGTDAFFPIAKALSSLQSAQNACMVSYRLKNTVSPYGGVTRGICRCADGKLSSIKETHNITLAENGAILSPEAESADGKLDGEELVSMNFWGFHKDALKDMQRYFRDFLDSAAGRELKSECLLPDYVGARIQEGKMQVEALSTDSQWFGMTYKTERDSTAAHLLALHQNGTYPEHLF